jgi:hypothetical protein
MDRWLHSLAGWTLAMAVPAAFAHAPVPAAAPPGPRLEFDQLSLSLPAGQPAPPPEAFEQQYAAALQALQASPSPTSPEQMRAWTADMPAPSSSASLAHQRERMVAAGVGEMAQGLALRSVPLLGSAAQMVEQGVGRHVEERRMQRMQAIVARQGAWVQAMLARPRLVHVSVWGDRVRVEDRDGGEVLLILPTQRVLLDAASRTYRLLPPLPPLPGEACNAPAREVTAQETRMIDGVAARGYRYRQSRLQPGTGQAREVSYLRYVGDQALPDLAQRAASASTCPAGSIAAASVPGHDRLVLYEAAMVAATDPGGTPPAAAALTALLDRTSVLWRGHLHPLDEGARGRFEIPADYRPAPSP